jgi:type III secretion system YscJ/HrcJ family lipoprotein
VTRSRSKAELVALLLGLTLTTACEVQVAGNLDEAAANRALLALDRGGIAASKKLDPRFDDRLILTVPSSDETRAVSLLAEQGLPEEDPPSILEALGDDTLVLSASAEQAKLMAGLAGELQRSLAALEGVQSARVHLSAAPPQSDPNEGVERLPPGASALLRYRGGAPPITAAEVQKLIAGAVPGLEAERVAVVMVPNATNDSLGPQLTRVGPFGIANGSSAAFKGFLATLVLLNVLLILVVAALWLKLRRRETVPPTDSPSSPLDDAGEVR